MSSVVGADVTDATLWRRAAAGDGDAFAALYLRHAKRIYNYLFRRLGDWSDAEDLLASVFLEAHRRRTDPALDPDRIVGWLFGVATILANNRRRSVWRRRRLFDRAAAAASIAASAPDSASRVEAQEQMRALLQRLKVLPKQQQDVVALCLWSGLSYEDAAAALSIPVGTVRSRLARARAALAAIDADERPEHNRCDAPGEVIP